MVKPDRLDGIGGTGGAPWTVSASGGGGGGYALPLPYVEPHEAAEAKKLIDEQFIALTGKPFGFRPAGYMIACKIHVSPDVLKEIVMPDGSKQTLWTPKLTQDQDVLTSVAALVCAVGPQAYKGFNADGTPRFPEGPWCRPGDFIVLPRASSFVTKYRGVAMAVIPDDKVIAVIEDPADVSEIYFAPKI